MKKFRAFATAVFLLLITLTAAAQRPYFVYLQTENQEPFFVQLNKKNHSSSSVGHIILSGLLNGTYTIQVGFPGQTSLQEYTFTVNGDDNGFVIKKFEGDAGYGMVNLQNATVQMNGSARKAQAEEEKNKALAAAEAQKMEAARIAEEERNKLEAAEAQKNETARIAAEERNKALASAEAQKMETARSAEEAALKAEQLKAAQLKAEQTKAAAPTEIVTVTPVKNENAEEAKPKADSIKVDVPPAKVVADAVNEEAQEVAKVNPAPLSAAEIAKLQEEARRIDAQGKRDSVLKAQKSIPEKKTNSNPAFLDIDFTMPADSSAKENAPKAADSVAVIVKPTAVETVTPAKIEEAMPVKNPNCNAEAADSDIELVGMLMKGEKQPEDALEFARKTLKVKCVTTAQLRKLVVIFERQEDRYTMLDMAYRYTSDKDKYAGLSDLLTDPYFLNRFKAMLQ